GTTLFMTLLAAFVVLLARYSGQEDIVVGSPIANRNRPEIEPLIGFFVNTLVLRIRLPDNPTFEELLNQVRRVALDAYAHQDLPFEKLVEELQPQRSLSYSPLFQVMFSLQNTPREELELPGLSLTRISDGESVAARFDLTLFISESYSGLTGMWRYNTDLFEAATIDRISDHFQTLLTAVVSNPQQPVDQLPLLQAAERHQLLTAWNPTQTEFPLVACLPQLFEAQVEHTPEATAVLFEGQQLSYRELNRRANQLAHYLQTLGVGPETPVGLYVERSLEMVVGLWGVLKAGGAYLPLDPSHPQQRVASLLEDAQVSVLLTQHHLRERLPDPDVAVVCLDTDWSLMAQQPQDNPNSALRPDNLAYVIYTSGSTGQPKGVTIEHRSMVNYLQAILQRLEPASGQHWALVSTIAADLGHTVLFPSLCTGGCLHLLSQDRVVDPDAFSDYFERHPIDILKITPSHLAALQSGAHPERVLPRQQLILGGETARADWVEQLQVMAPQCAILNHYGPTETTVGVLTYPVKEHTVSSLPLPLGRPLANSQVYILDKCLQPTPVGVPGELHIGGVGLARGYLNRPELTTERFIPDPFSDEPEARLYKTGDRARYQTDGNIEFLGRIDRQVKIRGFRIELGEIEAVLAQHPQVQQGIVVGAEDGPSNQRLVAYVVVAEASPPANELRRFLRERLPEYMTPSTFVMLDTLPLTPNGKVDQQALLASDTSGQSLETEFVAPRNETEVLLANIVTNVLGLLRLGVHDNFFDLGGHSLHATQAISRIRAAFAVELPLRRLFEYPTIAGLAEVLVSTQLEQADNALLEQILAEVHALPEDDAPEQVIEDRQLPPSSP
ncbi:MAG: amino acid adenylation domain-containing protein, partial [Pseudanabaenales cyanobacterium]|nr:amino acid adenylation domain-containing protein [Pseudanabaenales cyanobacterium]